MQSLLKAFFLLALLACLVTASPTRIQKRSFKVERVRNENFAGRNGPRALLKAYRKFGMPVPAGLADAATRRAEDLGFKENRRGGKAWINGAGNNANAKANANANANTAAVSNAKANAGNNGTANATTGNSAVGLVQNAPEGNDVEYLSPVTVGGQTLNLDFDSGSSDLWVFNTQLAAKAQTGHTIFDPTKSKTFQLQKGSTFSISYGDGSGAAGIVGTDTVNIGGATVTNQAVELATAVSNSFIQDTANNGLVGLAFSQLNTVKPQKAKTFFANVQNSLAEPLFTADLRHQAAGAYEFGRVDTTKFTGNMAWIPVNTTNGFWQFSTSKFAVGNGKLQTAVQNSQAIADTGTTLMLSNPTVVNGYYSQVQGAVNDAAAGGITVPCGATLPDLQLDVGGVYTAVVKGNTLNFSPVDKTNKTCFGGLQATTSGLEVWGDVFFKSQFVAFNGGNNSLGMAQHA